MTTLEGHEISAEERGDTAGPRRKIVTFAAVVVVISAAVVGIAAGSDLTSDDEPDGTRVTTGSARAIVKAVAPGAPAAADIAQAELVDAEDARIYRAVSRGTTTRRGVTTVALDRRDIGGAYGIDDLVALGAATRTGSIVTLHRPVIVRTGATLAIKAPGRTLRLAGTRAGPASIVAWGGSLTLSGSAERPLTIVGWDRVTKAADTDVSNGRGYVRSHSGRLAVKNVIVRNLGFWSGRTGGLAATGTSFDPGRAVIADTAISGTHVGLYLMGTRNARVDRTSISDADRDGVELDRSRGARLADVTVTGSGVSGVRVHDQSSALRITDGSSTGNAAYGIAVDGRPQADGPNTVGYNVVNASGLDVTGTTVSGNGSGGVQVTGTSAVVLSRLHINQDHRPVRVVGRSAGTSVLDSDIATGRGPVIDLVGQATDVEVRGNTLTGTTTGVAIEGAQVDISGNRIVIGEGRAVSVSGADAAGSVGDNRISGIGTDAFDIAAASTGFDVAENDVAQWETKHAAVEWIEENPFAPLWVAILLIPAIGLNFIVRRFRMHRDLRRLTEETVIAMAKTRRHGRPVAVSVVDVVEGVVETSASPAVVAPDLDPPEITRTDRLVHRGAMGQFGSAEDLAVHAVLQGGKSPEHVARTLQVPVAVVHDWLRRYQATS
ncbi:MAG: right-handed parallel beta-helix repeat-containing protein [Aeromicrobium sp.]|nr:right-handed parallel beta-helix repeat-containing protein [Aeromicrobium sp.]